MPTTTALRGFGERGVKGDAAEDASSAALGERAVKSDMDTNLVWRCLSVACCFVATVRHWTVERAGNALELQEVVM